VGLVVNVDPLTKGLIMALADLVTSISGVITAQPDLVLIAIAGGVFGTAVAFLRRITKSAR
jgi:hypothetical protein